MRKAIVLATLLGAVGLAACGDSIPEGVPDVRGLSLPDAEEQLATANLAPSTTSDGMFGVLVKGNWTVCHQKAPKGHLVPLEVSKDC